MIYRLVVVGCRLSVIGRNAEAVVGLSHKYTHNQQPTTIQYNLYPKKN